MLHAIMSDRLMHFKQIFCLTAILLHLCIFSNAVLAADSKTEIMGVVPRLLSAVSENYAKCHESSLGNAVADAMRIYLESDIAIICGGDITGDLPAGEVTMDGIKNVFTENRALATANVTIHNLRCILEVGLSHITLDESERIDEQLSEFDGFPQISGFILRYDAAAPVGERVCEIRINDEPVDLDNDENTVKLAASKFMFDGGYGLPKVSGALISEMTYSDVMARYVNDGIDDYSRVGSRIRPMGVNDGGLASQFPAIYIIAPVVLIVFFRVARGKNSNKGHDEMFF